MNALANLLFIMVFLAHPVAISYGQNNMKKPVARNRMAQQEAVAIQKSAAQYYGKTINLRLKINPDTGIDLVFIPPGEFFMGNEISQPEMAVKHKVDGSLFDLEYPGHRVTISRPFYIGRFEITQQQWRAVMNNNPSKIQGDSIPVEYISWEECVDFCTRLSSLCGMKVRLPTEAEWEYCCRAGTRTDFNFGDTCSTEWTNITSDHPVPVGRYQPNYWGLYDMHGNVAEWVSDFYGPYTEESRTDPLRAQPHWGTMIRGGGSRCAEVQCRSAFRYAHPKNMNDQGTGFRIVAEIE